MKDLEGARPGRRSRSRKPARLLSLILILLLTTTFIPAPPPPPPAGPGESLLFARPIALNPASPDQRRVGALVLRRAWELDSPEPRFGGISAMQVNEGRVTALSDSGFVFEFDLPGLGSDQRIRITPLAGPGPAEIKSNRDTEALAIHDGKAWVAFEGHNMIWRYDQETWKAESKARPDAMRKWERNGGAESLVRLPDGRFLAIAEGKEGRDYSEAVLFDGDPAISGTRAATLRFRRPPDYLPTDAALLPDGRLIVLSRRFSLFGGVSAALVLIDPDRLQPGAILEGEVIAELKRPLAVDNMEALSIALEDGQIVVRIASDDNYFALIQRSLLLEFVLDERALRRSRSPSASSPLRALDGAPSG